MRRRTFLASVGTAFAVGSAGCVGRAVTGIDYDVGMRSDGFVPQRPVDVPDDAPHWVPRDDPTIEVRVGDTVTWYNTGSRNHTVTGATERHDDIFGGGGGGEGDGHGGHHHSHPPQFPDGADYFASGGFETERAAVEHFRETLTGGGMIPPGETYEHTFETPGWYHYFCIPHRPAGMMGNVHVVE